MSFTTFPTPFKLLVINPRGPGSGMKTLPASPSDGTAVADGTGTAYGTYVQLSAGIGVPIYITGVTGYIQVSADVTFFTVGIGLGASGTEYNIADVKLPLSYDFNTLVGIYNAGGFSPMVPWLYVPTNTRIACRTATSTGTATPVVTLHYIEERDLTTRTLPGVQ